MWFQGTDPTIHDQHVPAQLDQDVVRQSHEVLHEEFQKSMRSKKGRVYLTKTTNEYIKEICLSIFWQIKEWEKTSACLQASDTTTNQFYF